VGEVESWIYVKGGKRMSWIPEAELPNDIAKLREELRAALTESVRPIRARACAWCEKDEMHVPLQDCMECEHSRQDDEAVWCSWMPEMKPCEGCGIPAEYCEPETCLIAQAIKKAAM
jgi:hypothetical protein